MDAHGGNTPHRVAQERRTHQSLRRTPAAFGEFHASGLEGADDLAEQMGLRFVLGLNSHDGGAPMPDPDPREQLQLRLRFLAIEANLRTAKRLAHERAQTDFSGSG